MARSRKLRGLARSICATQHSALGFPLLNRIRRLLMVDLPPECTERSPWLRHMKCRAALAAVTVSTLFSGSIRSQSVEPPVTPAGALSRKAGVVLGAANYIRVYKLSDCAYALPRAFPSPEDLLSREVLPAFPEAFRSELKASLEGARVISDQQAQAFVANAFKGVGTQLDRRTTCGLVGGLLVGIFSRALDDWELQKQAFRAGRMQ